MEMKVSQKLQFGYRYSNGGYQLHSPFYVWYIILVLVVSFLEKGSS